MGRNSHHTPAQLAAKLLQIRLKLGLSQNQMIRRLGLNGQLIQSHISAYEQANEKLRRVPPPSVLLAYARAISITGRGEFLETLLDDEMELPDILPADPINISPRGKRRSRLSKNR
ncbi:MAG TPA: helix-turn-helix transcriptional regulator [Pyrinomonadaceae bacterium]|nr:helix-turn-helix transcriptional regulator [Pyrinomonadaceae bacterium]